MKSDEKQLLNEWILQQSEFNKNDLLVTINDSKTVDYSETISLEKLSKIISISQNSIKESGINPFCQTVGTLNWEWNNQPIHSPIWIVPCHFKLDKVRGMVHLFPEEESGFVNPFLVKKLSELYDIQLDETNFDEIIDRLKQSGFEVIDPEKKTVGNFHHHRYVLLKELQELVEINQFSPALKQFLSGEKPQENHIRLPEEALFPYDTDHRNVFQLFADENCVVQGPPGTGKSQLLANIVGKLLFSDTSTVFVSEKRAALEVVKKRLSSRNLSQLSVIITDDLSVHDFITELKELWEFLDDYKPSKQIEFSTRKEQENNLQFVLDILNQPELIGGVSFSKFNELKKTILQPEGVNSSFQMLVNLPSLIQYEETLSIVKKLYDTGIATSVALISPSVLKGGNLAQLIQNIERTKELLSPFENIHPEFTINDCDSLKYESVINQLFQNELAKKCVSIIEPDSKAQKKFLKLYQEFTQLQWEFENSTEGLSDWKQMPSELELEYLDQLSKSHSLLHKFRLKKRWTKVNSLPVQNAARAIEKLKFHKEISKEQILVKEKLLLLGITDFSEMDALKASLHLFTKEKWEMYRGFSSERRQLLNQIDVKIGLLKEDLTTHYKLNKNRSIAIQLSELSTHLPQLIITEKELQQLTSQITEAFTRCHSFEEYQRTILGTHYAIFQSHYPTFSNFESNYLQEKTEALLDAEQRENRLTGEKILDQIKSKFDDYNRLLNTPATKLTSEQKAFRQQLKKGKSILVKEFAKTRQHPTLRELLHSEASWWIRLLKPVWFTNPVQLAKTFPIDEQLFDVCIMDEASQMSIQNGLGALQRSRRVIIAGDDQQMNPTAYFQAGTKETISMLQHAAYYLPKIALTHHYRSKHAPLIAFSNRHFYEDKLVVYPSYPTENDCITRHFCNDGKYIDRKNHEEAKCIESIIKKRLLSGKTIGVVAFSQEQIDAIWKACSAALIEEIQQRIEQNTFFIKPLEKVQGDECEHLIISLGYAPDEQGNFQLRFGPLNTESGRNRLNVLFSRASETIDFVCSIASSALQWSENESIQLLYKWLRELETSKEKDQFIQFPLGLSPIINGNHLSFTDSYESLPNALEFLTTYSVLSQRGWMIEMQN